jgi:hypothetical protein
MQRINVDPVGSDEWLCLCGNRAIEDGFYPCNSEGEQVEPTDEDWTTNCYVCDRCGRIIRQDSREVVGVRFENTLTEAEKEAIFRQQAERDEL